MSTRARPVSVTIAGWLFIAAGAMGLVYHAKEFAVHPMPSGIGWISFVRLLAIIGGVCVLRGRNWARWLLLVWLGYHVGLSVFHSPVEIAMHAGLLVIVAWLLFRQPATDYFRPG